MSNIDLYVQVDGEAEDPETAIADAAISETSVPFEEGQLVEVKIEAAWKDLDGKYHARVSLVRKLSPEEKPVKVAHDKITKPKNDNDSAMQNEPHMKMAEDDFEQDFDKAAEEKHDKLSQEISNSYKRQKKADPNQPKPDGDGEL